MIALVFKQVNNFSSQQVSFCSPKILHIEMLSASIASESPLEQDAVLQKDAILGVLLNLSLDVEVVVPLFLKTLDFL